MRRSETEGRVSVRRHPLPGDAGMVEAVHGRDLRAGFSPHAHAEYAIGVALEGSHRLEAGGCTEVLRAGDVIVLPPELVHAVDPHDDAPWSYLILYLPPIVLRRAMGAWDDTLARTIGSRPVIRCPDAADLVRTMAMQVLTGAGAGVGSGLTEILGRFATRYLEPVPASAPGGRDPIVHRFLELCDQNCGRPPELGPFAGTFGLSVFQLIRRFRAAVGVPPIAYHAQWRARRARDLLRVTRTVSEVAHRCGYSDESHLSRHFKRYYGIPPGAFARAVRTGGPA